MLYILKSPGRQLNFYTRHFGGHCFSLLPVLLDINLAYNMNNNPKNNILASENIRQKRLKILVYFDGCICYHYQIFDDKYMHQNIPEFLVFFVRCIPTLRCYFLDYHLCYMFCNCQEEMVFNLA